MVCCADCVGWFSCQTICVSVPGHAMGQFNTWTLCSLAVLLQDLHKSNRTSPICVFLLWMTYFYIFKLELNRCLSKQNRKNKFPAHGETVWLPVVDNVRSRSFVPFFFYESQLCNLSNTFLLRAVIKLATVFTWVQRGGGYAHHPCNVTLLLIVRAECKSEKKKWLTFSILQRIWNINFALPLLWLYKSNQAARLLHCTPEEVHTLNVSHC